MSDQTARAGLIVFALALAGCYRPPTESELIQKFSSHRSTYDKLVTMAVADSGFRRIPAEGQPPSGMPVSRFEEYLSIFHELGVKNGVNRGAPYFPDGLFVIASSCVPIGGMNQSIGYAYLPIRPHSLEERLPISGCPIQIQRGHGHEMLFRPLDGRWYLFYELDW